ncbi:MAG TPA: HD-GYP domain-containing protein [Gammaproteobacteria bacterium]|nr:HD-GYP domain-containing protein [Gammaproteobacteria bacterium]
MIKKIQTSELRTGMYIHDLDCGWMEHPFVSNRFAVQDARIIQKIASAGIRSVYIDTSRGKDVEEAPTLQEVDEALQAQLEQAANDGAAGERVSVASERQRAQALFREATSVIRNLMEDTRLGKQVEVASMDPLAERMVQSVFRNHHALTGISRIKTKDEYTFMHCVSVAGLLVTFAREQDFSEEDIHQFAIGGLIHDIGKTMTPQEVLNKPGKLEADEFEIMKGHVEHSRDILEQTMGISQTAMDISLMHHERIDGSGYPLGLSGEAISLVGRMSAIVDVYDALTSVRVYKDAWEPTLALKKLIEWSPDHFDRELVQHFIRCLGIYPVGSLVELESGLVGIVMEPGEDLLRPKLRIIYHGRKRRYEKVRDIDLARAGSERIVNAVSPADYGIDLGAFL